MKLQVSRTHHDARELHIWAARFSEEEPVSSVFGIWQGMLACPGRSTLVYLPVPLPRACIPCRVFPLLFICPCDSIRSLKLALWNKFSFLR